MVDTPLSSVFLCQVRLVMILSEFIVGQVVTLCNGLEIADVEVTLGRVVGFDNESDQEISKPSENWWSSPAVLAKSPL